MRGEPKLESLLMAVPHYPVTERSVEDALRDTDDFFSGRGPVHATLRRMAERLEREGILYAVIGAMAINLLGYARQTVDVSILLSSEGLERFRERFVGRGYLPAFAGAEKSFRDAEMGVRIDFIRAGEYPGDGKPKPLWFPDPADCASLWGQTYVIR